MKKKIRLFWWSEVYLMHKSKENYGDLLGRYLVEKISQKNVEFAHPKKFSFKDLWSPIYVAIGSILMHVNKKCIVWGSGIIEDNQIVQPAKFLAVRGPETRRVLIEQNHEVPEVYGDPAILLPIYYNPEISTIYDIGIIPHYIDFKTVKLRFENHPEIKVIDLMTNDAEATTRKIISCKRIISSSLHGLIVPHSYGIPALWCRFSDKLFGDNIKFKDYFLSVKLQPYLLEISPENLDLKNFEMLFETYESLPEVKDIIKLQNDLLRVCPFN